MTNDSLYRRTFVGRSNELAHLQSLYDRAVDGEGALAFVVGEPGIGKTALCEQLATYVSERGGLTLVGHCYEDGSLSFPYLAFVEAMAAYVRQREDESLLADLGTSAADVARIVPEVGERLSDIALRPAGDPESDRWRLLQAVASFLRRASARKPLLIVLEDLHWADRGTLDLLLHLARNLQGPSIGADETSRLLLLGTYRDVEVDRAHPLSSTLADLQRVSPPMRILLRGLTIEEVQRMYTAIRGQEVPAAQAEAVHRQTEGNPLFVQEVLRYLVEEGFVVRAAGQWVPARGESALTVMPEGLRDVVGKRLNRLSGQTNQVLGIAAVVGRDFRLDVLQRVSGRSEEEIFAALEEASERAVLEQFPSAGAISFRFTHAFYRQTLYEEMFAPRRIRLHQQVGRALEDVHANHLEEHAAELAGHFAQSTEDADLKKALRYCEVAAQRAMSVFAYGEAARLMEHAIEVQEVLDPSDNVKRCDLLLALAEALLPAGEPLRAIQDVCDPAYLIGECLQDSKRIQRAIRLAHEGMSRYGGPAMNASATGVLWSERAQSHSAPGTVDRVWADLETARVKAATRDFKEYRRFAKAALFEARELGVGEALLALAQISVTWISVADWQELPTVVDDAIAVLESSPTGGFQRMLAAAVFYRSMLSQGKRQRAEEILQLLSTMVERTKDRRGGLLQTSLEGQFAFWEGRLGEALEISLDILARGEEQGVGLVAATYARIIAVPTLAHLGRHEEALLNLGDSPALASQRTLRLAEAGRSEDAKDSLVRSMAKLEVAEHGEDLPIFELQLLLEAAVLIDDGAICAMLVELLWPLPPLAWMASASPTRVIGDALALLGRAADARAKYEAALNICQPGGFRPETALTRLSLAELLLEHYPDERDVAIEHLDFAIAELLDMKMQPALERALNLQGRRRVKAKKRLYPDSLSEREVGVLRLIAAGKTNQQIADELLLSHNTVGRHVSNIFDKISAVNRVEATVYARDHGLA